MLTFYNNGMTHAEASPSSRQRLIRQLEQLIANLLPGDRLPPVRELTQRYASSPVTVSAALQELARSGALVVRPGAGTFVARPPDRAAAAPLPAARQGTDVVWQTLALHSRPSLPAAVQNLFRPPLADTVPFADGYLDETLQPLGLMNAALGRVARRPGVWSRLPPEGLEALRAWFARSAGTGFTASDVVIVPGGQAAISTVFRSLLPRGAPVLVESPTYFGVLAAARVAGLQLVPVPTDQHGVRPDLLEQAFRSSGARAVYLQPLYANPTGAVLASERRAAVLDSAERAGAFVIEDDYARDLHFTGPAPPPLVSQGEGRVIYLRSLTKVTAAGLRIAALIAHGPVLQRLKEARAVEDFFPAALQQEVALNVLTSRGWGAHLLQLQEALRDRQGAALRALAEFCPQVRVEDVPQGGFVLWLRLPDGSGADELASQALRAGVQVSAGSGFFPAEPSGEHIRLSYAACSPARVTEGVRRLGLILPA